MNLGSKFDSGDSVVLVWKDIEKLKGTFKITKNVLLGQCLCITLICLKVEDCLWYKDFCKRNTKTYDITNHVLINNYKPKIIVKIFDHLLPDRIHH